MPALGFAPLRRSHHTPTAPAFWQAFLPHPTLPSPSRSAPSKGAADPAAASAFRLRPPPSDIARPASAARTLPRLPDRHRVKLKTSSKRWHPRKVSGEGAWGARALRDSHLLPKNLPHLWGRLAPLRLRTFLPRRSLFAHEGQAYELRRAPGPSAGRNTRNGRTCFAAPAGCILTPGCFSRSRSAQATVSPAPTLKKLVSSCATSVGLCLSAGRARHGRTRAQHAFLCCATTPMLAVFRHCAPPHAPREPRTHATFRSHTNGDVVPPPGTPRGPTHSVAASAASAPLLTRHSTRAPARLPVFLPCAHAPRGCDRYPRHISTCPTLRRRHTRTFGLARRASTTSLCSCNCTCQRVLGPRTSLCAHYFLQQVQHI